jgi:hypothetical protein
MSGKFCSALVNKQTVLIQRFWLPRYLTIYTLMSQAVLGFSSINRKRFPLPRYGQDFLGIIDSFGIPDQLPANHQETLLNIKRLLKLDIQAG